MWCLLFISWNCKKNNNPAWSVLQTMPHLHKLFAALSYFPRRISTDQFEQIERFTILLYHRTSELTSVNDLRQHLFSQNRNIDNLPPTKMALRWPLNKRLIELCFWQDSYGDRPSLLIPLFHHQKIGDGNEMMTHHCPHTGLLFLKHPKHAGSS